MPSKPPEHDRPPRGAASVGPPIQKAVQVVFQDLRRGIPARWVFLQAFQANRLEIKRDLGTPAAGSGGLGVDDQSQRVELVCTTMRWTTAEKRVKDGSQAIRCRPLRPPSFLRLARAHVWSRAHRGEAGRGLLALAGPSAVPIRNR